MTPSEKPKSSTAKGGASARRARQAEALRANLRRRKAAAREGAQGEGAAPRRDGAAEGRE